MAAQGTRPQRPKVLKVRSPSLETLNLKHTVTMPRMTAQKLDVDSDINIPGLVSGLFNASANRTQIAKIDMVQMVV